MILVARHLSGSMSMFLHQIFLLTFLLFCQLSQIFKPDSINLLYCTTDNSRKSVCNCKCTKIKIQPPDVNIGLLGVLNSKLEDAILHFCKTKGKTHHGNSRFLAISKCPYPAENYHINIFWATIQVVLTLQT